MKKNNLGFTLTELMMTLAVLGIISLVFPQIMTAVTRFNRIHTAKVEIQRDARVCLDTVNRFLREGSGGSVTIDQASGQPAYSRITFSAIDGRSYRFYQSGKKLYMEFKTSAGAAWSGARILSENVRYVAFTYPRSDNDDIISVSLTMEKATYQGGAKALQLSIEKVRVMNP